MSQQEEAEAHSSAEECEDQINSKSLPNEEPAVANGKRTSPEECDEEDPEAHRPSSKRQRTEKQQKGGSQEEEVDDFDPLEEEGEDSFDEDFGEENGEDEIVGDEEEEFDVEDYIKWRKENPDAGSDEMPQPKKGSSKGGDKKKGADDDEDDCYDDEDDQ